MGRSGVDFFFKKFFRWILRNDKNIDLIIYLICMCVVLDKHLVQRVRDQRFRTIANKNILLPNIGNVLLLLLGLLLRAVVNTVFKNSLRSINGSPKTFEICFSYKL